MPTESNYKHEVTHRQTNRGKAAEVLLVPQPSCSSPRCGLRALRGFPNRHGSGCGRRSSSSPPPPHALPALTTPSVAAAQPPPALTLAAPLPPSRLPRMALAAAARASLDASELQDFRGSKRDALSPASSVPPVCNYLSLLWG